MSNIDLNQLTEDQKKALQKQWAAEEKEKREAKAKEKEVLKTLVADVVKNEVPFFIKVRGKIEDRVVQLFEKVDTLIEMRANLYGNKKREQDSQTFTLEDGSASIRVGWNVYPSFNGTEVEGIVKIRQYVSSLTGSLENEKIIMDIINVFLKTDTQGNYDPKKVRELNSIRKRTNSDLFNEGMDIINDALIDIRTSRYVRGYQMMDFGDGIAKRVNFNFSID